MIAQVSIYDDGKFLNPRPIYIEPSDVESNEIETTYTFAFRYSVLKEDAIDKLMMEVDE